jgi:endogenous inhibitor of DNA gyrase (YacG/DUF329 family)
VTAKNTGHLLSVYCPACHKVTDKISYNLLREAGKVTVYCPLCQRPTYIHYDGKSAQVYHPDEGFERIIEEMKPAERKDFKEFVKGGKNEK